MGIGNISLPQILIILVIVLLIFGTKRIRNIGSDLGGAIREFRKGVGENDDEESGDEKSRQKTSQERDGSEGSDESTSKRES